MLEYGRDRRQQVKLGAPVPHLDQGAIERPAAEQRRVRLKRLEVAAYRHRFGNRGAVVEDKSGKPLHRIERSKAFAAVLQGADVHLLGRNLDPFLGQEDAHPPRVRRLAEVVELHRDRPPSYPVDGATLSRTAPACQHAERPALRPPERLSRLNPRSGKVLSLLLRNFGDL